VTTSAAVRVPAEGAQEHVRNALAILRPQIARGAAAGELALDLRAVVARLEQAVAALDGRSTPTPRVPAAPSGHPVSVTLELVWPTSCVWLADASHDSPGAAELLAHWQSCGQCHADAARAAASVVRRSWIE